MDDNVAAFAAAPVKLMIGHAQHVLYTTTELAAQVIIAVSRRRQRQ
jgi:hypothetical protein